MGVLTYILGRAGSGKTEHIFRAIERATRAEPLGAPIFYLLPKQATFTAERELTARLGAFARPRVLSMEMLGEEVLADCGGTAAPQIDGLGRQLLIGHLLRKHQSDLVFFRSSARQVGLAAEIDATFGEFERAGKGEEDLRLLENELAEGASDARSGALLTKVKDLRLLYERYNAYLGQGRLDPHRRLTQVLEALSGCALFRDSDVYVDGFYEFTAHERQLILGMVRACRRVYVALTMDPRSGVVSKHHELPHDLSVFHPVEQTYRRLRIEAEAEHLTVTGAVVMEGGRRFRSAELLAVEEGMSSADGALAMESRTASSDCAMRPSLRPSPGVPGEGEGASAEADPTGVPGAREEGTGVRSAVRFIEASDRRTEVDAAAREIRELLRADGTLRLRDVVVLVRDLDDYQEIIHAAFNEHRLPYFVDRRRTAAHHPVVQGARCALALARGQWPHGAALTLLKTGLIPGVTLEAADELENYVLTHRIRGRAWGKAWTFQRTIRHGGDEAAGALPQVEVGRVNATREAFVTPVMGFIREVGAARTVREFTGALFGLYETLGVRATVAGWMGAAEAEGSYEQRGEHEQVWANFVGLLDQVVELLGDQEVTLGDYQDILESGLERFDLALTPPTVDQVLVGQVDRTRTAAGVRVGVVLGLSEGMFPRVGRAETIFSDHERKNLRERKVDVAPEAERRLLDENFLAYVAMTRGSEKLILTRPAADAGGRPVGPSVYWRKLREEVFPDAKVVVIPRESRPSVDYISTPRQLVVGLMRWARDPGGHADAAWPALYQWLAKYSCCDDAVDVMRYAAWRALSYRNEARLSKSTAAAIFPVPLRATVSRIESFATCPFQHFLRYGLGLAEREEADLTAGDMGAAFHSVLDHVVGDMLREQKDWAGLSAEEARALVHKYAQQIARSLRGELLLESARNQYILRRIERSLMEFVEMQRALAARGTFRPAHAGVRFGGKDGKVGALRVTTPGGKAVEIEGKIDRVDLVAGGPHAAVVDYKLAGESLALDRVYHGLALQLVTGLLVLQAQGEELAGRALSPEAAFYLRLVVGLNTVNHPDEAVAPPEEAFYLRVKPRGLVAATAVGACDSSFSTGKSEVIAAQRNAEGWSDRDRTDVAEDEEFRLLLGHVKARVGALADELIEGKVTIGPYRLGDRTPCPKCSYRSVCRFDPVVNRYHKLRVMRKTEVWAELKAKGGSDV